MLVQNESSGSGGELDYWYDREIAEGEHPAVVLDAAEQISSTGNPMLVLVMGVDGGGSEGGVKVNKYVPCHVPRRIEELVSCFFRDQLKEWNDGEEINLDPTEIIRMKCRVEVKLEEWNDKVQAKIETLIPVENFEPDPANQDIPF